jgi:4-amino-4-deoxy-L-arabinose transferase-like glycosyltransferase
MHETEAATIGESEPPASAGADEVRDADSPARRVAEVAEDRESSEVLPVRPPRRLGLATLGVFVLALAALVPTVGDLGLTWDEPAYRYSQLMSVQWWEKLVHARSWDQVRERFDPLTLLYYWPYGRYGINFHPPLAGQLNLATYELFGHWMKDIPARRMASVLEFALTIAIGFHFLARRYGIWVGVVMAGSLLFMPRLYGQAHLIDTDTPGLLLWAAIALAFWKGLNESNARRWRVAVGILMGLAFVEKMAAVMVLIPLLLWIGGRAIARPPRRADWIDGLVITGAMLVPLLVAFQQIQMLQRQLPPPANANLFVNRPAADWPGAILAVPLFVWVVRRLLGRFFPGSKVWGVERPALETLTAMLAFAPVVGWLGNPAWWVETLPRLAHYYTLSTSRRGVLPDIQILYFGQLYEFCLPWLNAFVLMGITVPVAVLGAGVIGITWGLGRIRSDRLPFYFLIHFLTLPVVRMFPTPAHDGVRLFLPTFFFLAAFAGWGAVCLADQLTQGLRIPSRLIRPALAGLVLGSAAFALIRIHPYELSYYNELIGGPRGAWERGFELTYWYDAFNGPVIDELNRRLPPNASVGFLNDKTLPVTFQELQTLGEFRGDIQPPEMDTDRFSYVWLLTQDSKASAFTRLLFAMRPWYASEPRQLAGARVASVVGPVAASRAWALTTLLDAPDRTKPPPPAAPMWVYRYVPWLARLWGDGLLVEYDRDGKSPRVIVHKLAVNPAILDWSRNDSEGLLAAAKAVASRKPIEGDEKAKRLLDLMTVESSPKQSVRHFLTNEVLRLRPQALVEAVEILNARRDDVVRVMTRYGYTDPSWIGGYLDRDLTTDRMDR